jgi:hypothetical protein
MSQPHFKGSVRSSLTFSKMGLESPLGLPKTQSSIVGVKTRCFEVFFIPLEKVLKCRCSNWPRMCHFDICSTSYGRMKGRESNWQFDSRPLKVGNRLDPGACRWSVTHCWKAPMTRSQVTRWNPLEGSPKSSCGKLRLEGTFPASNSRKG